MKPTFDMLCLTCLCHHRNYQLSASWQDYYVDPLYGGSTYCLTAVSVSVCVSVSVRSHPKAPPAKFFRGVHQNMIPAI